VALAPALGLPAWPGWRNLPRDARDTLFQLGVVAWTIFPHFTHLPFWCTLLALLMLFWRGQLAVANAPLPSRAVVLALLGLAMGLTVWSEGTLIGKEAGVTMLVVLLTLKTLELRARRDALVLFFLGFFVVLTHFLYSQSLLLAVAMLGSVAGLLMALVLAHMPVGRPALAKVAGIALKTALMGAPIMVALFLLFPRIGPLWGVPQEGAGRTGLSGSLSLGGMANVANDDSIALRLRFKGAVPAPRDMYFRGPVLGGFDGNLWTRQSTQPAYVPRQAPRLQALGPPVTYEMTLEPSRMTVLPLLEAAPNGPQSTPDIEGYGVFMQPDMQWALDRPLTERVRFNAVAWPRYRAGGQEFEETLRPFLQLPSGFNPRTVAWAQALRQQPNLAQAEPTALVQTVLEHVRRGGYTYTLEPGSYGRDAIDEFWLDRKLGFCEHFSASFVVVMRALHIPARIVTGYQGTDREPVDGYYIVRQRNAHAWAEYWQHGLGWVRVDPTAAVAPERVMRGNSLAPTGNRMADALQRVNPELMTQLRSMLEATNNRWNQWVMNYSRVQQFRLLENLGLDSPDWMDLAYVLIGLLVLASLGALGWALWDRQRQDPWARLQNRVATRLQTLGVAVGVHEAPRARATRVRAALGSAGEPLAGQLEALERLRYAGASPRRPDPAWWRGFEQAAAQVGR
jgi:protein-glutamine gamma-glutamyltransferase